MTQDELNLILQEGEGYKIEFKENVNSDLSKELVAFANSSGERIFIGVRDNSTINGIAMSNKLMTQIQDTANNCDKPIKINLEYFSNILIVTIPEGTKKPYRCNTGFYIRSGAISQKLTTDQIIDFIQTEGRVRFDELENDRCDFNSSFSPQLLTKFLNLSSISQSLNNIPTLNNLEVIDEEANIIKFRNSGVLFFTEKPVDFIPQANIVCARYEGNDKINILDRKELSGDIISNIEDAVDFIKRHIKIKFKIEGTRREELLEIPEVALREAIVNAIAHRDYFEKGANIMIEVFDNRIEFTNPGGLPKGFPVDDFGKISLTRNPTIASLLLRAKYIEKMGTGINRIRKSFIDYGLPEPLFKYDSFFNVVFKRKDLLNAFNHKYNKFSTQSIRMVDILQQLYKRLKIDVKELASKHKVSDRTIRTDLETLSSLGLINTQGKAKDKTYNINASGDDFVATNS